MTLISSNIQELNPNVTLRKFVGRGDIGSVTVVANI